MAEEHTPEQLSGAWTYSEPTERQYLRAAWLGGSLEGPWGGTLTLTDGEGRVRVWKSILKPTPTNPTMEPGEDVVDVMVLEERTEVIPFPA